MSDFNCEQMKTDLETSSYLSAQIAKAIRDAIVEGKLLVDERLPSEAESLRSNLMSPDLRCESPQTPSGAIAHPNPKRRIWRGFYQPSRYETPMANKSSTLLLSMTP